jgi:peptidyl-prolyl cis-trans isomerase D
MHGSADPKAAARFQDQRSASMLTFIRKIIFSRIGALVTLIVVGLIGVAFGLGDVTGLRSNALGGQNAATAATVGNDTISVTDLRNSTNSLLERARSQQPQATMEMLLQQGGLELTLNQQIDEMAKEQFAHSQGIRVGKSLIDNQIVNIPGIRGLDGKFDKDRYNNLLAFNKLNDQQLHDQIGRQLIAQLMLGPIATNATDKLKGPVGVATSYASMLLEKRSGTVAFVDTKKMPVGAPVTDAEASAYYKRNIARYTISERRSARYALITLDELKKRATPTDDEIAKAYQAQKAKFDAGENRSLKQVVLQDQKAAADLAAKVRGGTAIEAAAKALGLEAAAINDVNKTAYAGQATPALADQVFGAAQGAVIGPVKTPLGWVVAHLDKITKVAGKTLDQAKPELVKELTDQKLAAIAQTLRDQIEDAITNRQTLDQIAAKLSLTVQATTPLTVNGTDPTAATPVKPDPNQTTLYQLAFQSEAGDDPQLVPYGQDGSFAVAKLDKVIPAAARPLATIADQVKKDVVMDRQLKAARDVANGIAGKVNKGIPLAQAMAESGIKLDATKPMSAYRAQRVATKQPPDLLVLLFSKPKGSASLVEAPYKGGWFVIVVDSIDKGNASGNAQLIDKMRGDLGASMGDEYREQFARAVRDKVGVKKNDAAIAALRRELLGQGSDGADQPQ